VPQTVIVSRLLPIGWANSVPYYVHLHKNERNAPNRIHVVTGALTDRATTR